VWRSNLDVIRAHNAAGKSWTMAMNQFGDLTAAEFTARHAATRTVLAARRASRSAQSGPGPAIPLDDAVPVAAPPASWDWREHNAVGPTPNEGQCGTTRTFLHRHRRYGSL
jgi:hypothetical protein